MREKGRERESAAAASLTPTPTLFPSVRSSERPAALSFAGECQLVVRVHPDGVVVAVRRASLAVQTVRRCARAGRRRRVLLCCHAEGRRRRRRRHRLSAAAASFTRFSGHFRGKMALEDVGTFEGIDLASLMFSPIFCRSTPA